MSLYRRKRGRNHHPVPSLQRGTGHLRINRWRTSGIDHPLGGSGSVHISASSWQKIEVIRFKVLFRSKRTMRCRDRCPMTSRMSGARRTGDLECKLCWEASSRSNGSARRLRRAPEMCPDRSAIELAPGRLVSRRCSEAAAGWEQQLAHSRKSSASPRTGADRTCMDPRPDAGDDRSGQRRQSRRIPHRAPEEQLGPRRLRQLLTQSGLSAIRLMRTGS